MLSYFSKSLSLFFILCSLLYLFLSITLNTTLDNLKHEVNSYTEKSIIFLYNTYDKNIPLICDTIRCDSITIIDYKNDIVNTYTNNQMVETINLSTYNQQKMLQDKNSLNFTSDDLEFKIKSRDIFLQRTIEEVKWKIFVTCILVYGFIHLIISFFIRRFRNKETSFAKYEIETNMHRELTESLHHELQGPLTIVTSLLKEIYAIKYPCNKTIDFVCDFRNENLSTTECNGCETRNCLNRQRHEPKDIQYYYSMLLNLDRIKSVLAIMANTKHIKYTNGTVSINQLLNNVLNSRKFLNLNQFQYEIYKRGDDNKTNADLDIYAVGGGLNNGLVLNVINNLVSNSLEAKASTITIEYKLRSNMLDLFIKDDGVGINTKDKANIFKYGYSSKDKRHNSSLRQMLHTIYSFLLGTDVRELSSRGSGLAICKNILQKGDGDIKLVSTSSKGTEFMVTIPIKRKRKDDTEIEILKDINEK